MTPPADWVTQIFDQFEVRLVAYVHRRIGDLDLARDIVQEAFTKLCQESWPDIKDRAIPWLYTTCRNRSIDISRREGRMPVTHKQDVGQIVDQRHRSPSSTMETTEQVDCLRAHLGNLSSQQQEILRLRLQDGLSYREIATVTGLTTTNVGYHIHQAITQLRSRMLNH